MSEALKDYITNHIATHGPMDVGQFMSVALCHPEHGYYMKQDPFGKEGDFTTAPEISQMFGEVIGAWIADLWLQMGKPAPFGLVECGPGRGTLMADIMRATSGVEGFHAACIIHLIEISPTLKAIQNTTLKEYEPNWHQSLGAVPTSYPLIILGNEFFDALPFRQLVKTPDGWSERVVTGEMTFGLRPAGPELTAQIPEHIRGAQEGSIFELSPTRSAAMENIASLLQDAGGAGLFIDYGYETAATGDSFQALKAHGSVSVLEYIGDADLTSHVNFDALTQAAKSSGLAVQPITTQGTFLRAIGIEARAQYLMKQANDNQRADIESALKRLCDPAEMGELFKVFSVSYGQNIKPAGFDYV